jgi:hypothetical protein
VYIFEEIYFTGFGGFLRVEAELTGWRGQTSCSGQAN